MAGLKPVKAQLTKMQDALVEVESESDLDVVAARLLTIAWELYEQRAKFIVIGQSARDEDFRATKTVPAKGVSLGCFATQGDAEKAADSLIYSAANPNEPMHVWVLPIFKGTAHEYHSARKDARNEAAAGVSQAERLVAEYRATTGSPPCEEVLDFDAEAGEFVTCALFKYHPGEHLLLADAKKRECEGMVPVPGDKRTLHKCDDYLCHPGPCHVEAPLIPEEEA